MTPRDSASAGTALEGLAECLNPTGALQLCAKLSATGRPVAFKLPGAKRVGRDEKN